MAWVLFVGSLTALLLGIPIFVVLLVGITAGMLFFTDVPMAALPQNLFAGINVSALLAVPFFIFAGELMSRGSLARRLVAFVDAGVGSLPGGLGVTTVGTSTLFGAISGASVATVATVGKVMHPAMISAGYPPAFAAGLVTAVGAIDIVIPPSIPMIVYAMAASESVPRLYAAGVLPGLLLALLLAGYVVWFARRHALSRGQQFRLSVLGQAAWHGAWSLGAPVVILGGIYAGVFSPSEAGGIASVYALAVSRLVYRELDWPSVFEAARTTVAVTGQVMVIVACANVFGWLLTVNHIPAMLVGWTDSLHLPTWALLLAINILLLIAGCFLDPTSSILLFCPLLVPLVNAAGIDTVHFGVIMMLNLAIGLFHPPFGLNIFVAQSVLRVPLPLIYRGIVPFLGVYLLTLGLVTYVPSVSMFSANLLLPP